MKYIAIFCGTAIGNKPVFSQQADLLGSKLVEYGYGIVYGGAGVGLMGVVADSVLKAGGEVIGVIPQFLKRKELEHNKITKTYVVDTMDARKRLMNELCSGVITLPGGFGTMDEYFEMLTLGQLALHKKPVALLNTDGYYNPLLIQVENMIENGFLKEEYRELLLVDSDVDRLLDSMNTYAAPKNEKWFEPQMINR